VRHNSRLRKLSIVCLSYAIARVLRWLGRTWRVASPDLDSLFQKQRLIGATWHQGLLIGAYLLRDRGLILPVSLSKDGDLSAAVLARLGFGEPARGSSSRGAVTLLRQLIQRANAGEKLAVVPDGPRGPAREVKPGVLAIARAAELSVVPIGFAARPCWRLGSWDRAILPLPFAHVSMTLGEIFTVPHHDSAVEVDWKPLCDALKQRLDAATREAEARLL